MDARAKGGLISKVKRAGLSAGAALTFARLFLLPARPNSLPRDICLQPGVTDIAHRVDYGASGSSMDEPFSDAELDDWLFAECSDAQHASGTCRMGAPDDARSVVDHECRVIGCTGLRVIDASIMPEVPRANTHLTTVAIAERMADRLKGAR